MSLPKNILMLFTPPSPHPFFTHLLGPCSDDDEAFSDADSEDYDDENVNVSTNTIPSSHTKAKRANKSSASSRSSKGSKRSRKQNLNTTIVASSKTSTATLVQKNEKVRMGPNRRLCCKPHLLHLSPHPL